MRNLPPVRGRAWSRLVPFLSLVLTVVLAGCGSGNSTSSASTGGTGGAGGAAGTGGVSDAGPPGPAAGVLRVNVSGLPAGQKALVAIRGNNLHREVTTTTDVPLPPGAYTVEAVAVTDGNHENNTGYAPDQQLQQVTLVKGSGATVDVNYQELAPKISAATKVADSSTIAALDSVTGDPTAQRTLTFTSATSQTSSWKPGDIVMFGQTPQTPDGLFGKVVSSDGTSVVVAPTSVQSVLQQGVMSYSASFTAADVLGSSKIDSGTLVSPTCASLTAKLPATKGSATVALEVKGTLCFSPSIDFDAWLDSKLKLHAYFDVGAGVSSDLTVTGTAGIAISGTYPLLDVDLPKFTIWTGPVPWVIVPKLVIEVGASGQVTVGVTAGVSAYASAHGGFSYDDGSFSPHSSHSENFTTHWPTPIATAQLKGFGGPQLEILIDDLAGPFFNVEGYIQYDVDLTTTPIWKLHAGFDVNAGLTTNDLIGYSYSKTLYNFDKVIAQATDTPPVGAQTGTYIPGGTDNNIALGPNDTVYVPAGNDIKSIDVGAAVPKELWAFTAAQATRNVLRAADGSIYATDYYGGVYGLTSGGAQRWAVNPASGARSLASPSANTLYISTDTGVASLSTTDGSTLWYTNFGDSEWDIAVAKDGTIYAPHGSSVSALTPSGAIEWTATWNGQVTLGTAIAPDGTIYAIGYAPSSGLAWNELVAIQPNGQIKWYDYPLQSDQPSMPTVGPDGTVYLCGSAPGASTVAVDGTDGHIKWTYHQGENCKGPPAVGADGKVYLITGAKLRALDAQTGQVVWSHDTLDIGGTPFGSPLFLSNGKVVGVNESGLYVFQAGTSLATSGWPRVGGNAMNTGVQQ